ncbi:hypothetical protein ACGFNY_44705 [Streptomyces chartreusis]
MTAIEPVPPPREALMRRRIAVSAAEWGADIGACLRAQKEAACRMGRRLG